jgi:hypothetical protein
MAAAYIYSVNQPSCSNLIKKKEKKKKDGSKPMDFSIPSPYLGSSPSRDENGPGITL